MPQQGFLRVWKYKSGDLHHIQRHNERDPDTKLSAEQLESIDQSLTNLSIIRLKSDKTFLGGAKPASPRLSPSARLLE